MTRQTHLPFAKPTPARREANRAAAASRYDEQNRQTALIILRRRERYAGLPVEWAEGWAKSHGVCPVCGGTGAEFPGNPFTEKCFECDGTGRYVGQ